MEEIQKLLIEQNISVEDTLAIINAVTDYAAKVLIPAIVISGVLVLIIVFKYIFRD